MASSNQEAFGQCHFSIYLLGKSVLSGCAGGAIRGVRGLEGFPLFPQLRGRVKGSAMGPRAGWGVGGVLNWVRLSVFI